MRWTPEGLDALLPLRTAVLNDAYDSFWEEEFARLIAYNQFIHPSVWESEASFSIYSELGCCKREEHLEKDDNKRRQLFSILQSSYQAISDQIRRRKRQSSLEYRMDTAYEPGNYRRHSSICWNALLTE